MGELSLHDSSKGLERRQFSRVEFEAEVILTQKGESFCGELVDISLNGALVSTPTHYQVRTDLACDLEIRLSFDNVIHMKAALVHSSSEVLGFQCTSIDMESIVVLRRLMEVNLDDPSASERVLAELLKRYA